MIISVILQVLGGVEGEMVVVVVVGGGGGGVTCFVGQDKLVQGLMLLSS